VERQRLHAGETFAHLRTLAMHDELSVSGGDHKIAVKLESVLPCEGKIVRGVRGAIEERPATITPKVNLRRWRIS
jgi:hypothetical protein